MKKRLPIFEILNDLLIKFYPKKPLRLRKYAKKELRRYKPYLQQEYKHIIY